MNTKKWIGITEDGKVLYQADNIPEAEKYSVTYQIKHTIKINPKYLNFKGFTYAVVSKAGTVLRRTNRYRDAELVNQTHPASTIKLNPIYKSEKQNEKQN